MQRWKLYQQVEADITEGPESDSRSEVEDCLETDHNAMQSSPIKGNKDAQCTVVKEQAQERRGQ